MDIQVNQNFVKAGDTFKHWNGGTLMITPPLDEGYWLMRIPLSDSQAIVCFPKFGTVGIGFQHEEDWNTNLPYTADAREIFAHIAHNKGDDFIPDAACIEAIESLQRAIKVYRGEA